MATIRRLLEQAQRDEYVSATALAAFYGVSARTVHRLAERGRCPHRHVGHQIRYRREQLLRLMAEHYPADPES
jgi:phage terminase Nu1 subunit (DNA packaging protein)